MPFEKVHGEERYKIMKRFLLSQSGLALVIYILLVYIRSVYSAEFGFLWWLAQITGGLTAFGSGVLLIMAFTFTWHPRN